MKTLIKFAAIILAVVVGFDAQAKDLQDMVVVNTSRPFYIDIFEVTCSQTAAKIGKCNWGSTTWKPTRLGADEADLYCPAVGKRLPTMDEWLAAATNLGANARYSLRNDSLTDASGKLQVNIRGSESLSSIDFNVLGIDAIGTVGMTGNRREWVRITDSNGKPALAQCGGEYETQRDGDVEFKNICVTDPSQFHTATNRCVVDATGDETISYSQNVKGELAQYIATLNQTPMADPSLSTDDVLIPRNPYSGNDNPNDPELIKPATPNYADEY